MKPILSLLLIALSAVAADRLPLLHHDDFEAGGDAWQPSDAQKWTVDKQDDGNHVLHLHGKSAYEPPFRSPHSITLLKDKVVGSFELTAKVRTLQTTRGHRDMCVFFNFQDPAHFYYVHLGEVPDPHSSQIFIVNQAPRTKITESPDVGVNWEDGKWHDVKVVRDVASGLIAVYFDDMEKPQKVAHDKTFTWGAVGLGSFDDLGLWDDFELRGVTVKKKVDWVFKSAPKPEPKKKPAKKKVSAEELKALLGGEISAVSASASQTGNPPVHVIDGNAKTKWAALGKGQWIEMGFAQPTEVKQVGIGFVAGHRRYAFEIHGRVDGKLKALGSFTSTGKGDGIAGYEVPATKVTHLRIVVNGSNENDWANIHTVAVNGTQTAADVASPSGDNPELAEQAKTLKFTKWSGDVNIPDPVAISLDNHGVAYVTQTQRRKANDLDIRANRDWIPDDVGFQSIDDKRAHFHTHLAPAKSNENKERVADHNGDGSHDWKDLTFLTERIYQVRDTDGDGTADQRVTYAEEFNTEVTGIAAGVLWYEGDVYATVAPDVWRLHDADGDGKADQRDVMAHGFGLHIAYGGHDMHGLRVGPDGRIYWSIGDKGISVVSKEGRRFFYPNQGGVLRCEPDGSNFEVFAHGLRNVQEFDFDEHGNWFGVDNDSDQPGEKERFVHIVEDMDAGWRNNYQYRGDGFNPWMDEALCVPWHEGQPAYVLPPIRNYEDGPCGFVYNPGTALNPQYRGYFFMTEAPRGSQWAFQVRPKGASFEMINSHQIGNGIALTGWNFGPDGALYGVDWGGGYPLNEKGAIWKIDDPEYADDAARAEVRTLLGTGFRELSRDRLAALLAHIDKRVRLGAQFELVRREDTSGFKSALKNGRPLARIHSLWGLGQLARTRSSSDARKALLAALDSRDEDVQEQALKMLGDLEPRSFPAKAVLPLLRSRNPRVLFQAAITAGKHAAPGAPALLIAAADRLQPDETYLRHAIIKGLSGTASADELARLKQHENELVRICSVVALRRQASTQVGVFLNDASQRVADEAARAIHDDWSITAALPQLAARLGGRSEPFVRRAISASLRLGTPEAAARVSRYASNTKAPTALRLEALAAIQDWLEPPLLDRVDGRRRDLGKRDRQPIARAIAADISHLLKSGDNALIERAVAISTQYDLKPDPGALTTLLQNAQAPASLRVVALRGLNTSTAVDYALKSKPAELRSEAARLLAKLDADAAVRHLHGVLDRSRSLREQQAALATLSGMQHAGAKAIVVAATERLAADQVQRGLQLDIIEAAEKLGLEDRLEAFNKRRDPENYNDGFIECVEGGDPVAGLKVINTHIYAQCVRCHKLDNSKGGSIIGPNLKNVGSKGRDYILQSMLDPNAVITDGYGTINVVLQNDEVIGGQFRKETKTHVELRMPDGKTEKIAKSEIKDRTPLVSVMPTMGNILTKRELRDVIEHLAGLVEVDKKKAKK